MYTVPQPAVGAKPSCSPPRTCPYQAADRIPSEPCSLLPPGDRKGEPTQCCFLPRFANGRPGRAIARATTLKTVHRGSQAEEFHGSRGHSAPGGGAHIPGWSSNGASRRTPTPGRSRGADDLFARRGWFRRRTRDWWSIFWTSKLGSLSSISRG